MRAVLEIRSGTDTARRVVVSVGTPRVIGRAQTADEPFPHDPWMSDQHAALWFDGAQCYVRDLGSQHGTFVNDRGVSEAAVAVGDRVQVGGTLFVLRVEGAGEVVGEGAADEGAVTFERRVDHVLWALRDVGGKLYGVLDSARDDAVLPFLMASDLQYQSLYEGVRGQEMALVAPYLVAFPEGAAALEELVTEAWGKSWGVFLATSMEFRDVRRHLRRFLKVELDDGERVLFRFYDPRVLRAYLPTCNGEESAMFFGAVGVFMAEGRGGETLLKFRAKDDGVSVESVALVEDVSEMEEGAVG